MPPGWASPELRLLWQAIPSLTWTFMRLGGRMFWLLQGERDRGADDVEGFPLLTGRLGEHGHGGLGPTNWTWLRVRVARCSRRPRKLR